MDAKLRIGLEGVLSVDVRSNQGRKDEVKGK